MFCYNKLSPMRKMFVDTAIKHFPELVNNPVISRREIEEVVSLYDLNFPQWFTTSDNSQSRGLFYIPLPTESVNVNTKPNIEETDEEIGNRIDAMFLAIDSCVRSIASGDIKSLILSGPPGIGKTHEITKVLEELDYNAECNFNFVSGKVKATGLYKLLYDNRFSNDVLVLDDTDSALDSEDSLNILKKACDLRDIRKISWLTEAKMVSEEDGADIPKSFDYEGSIIFITNKDFDSIMKKDSKLSPHLEALISRSLYINLGIKTNREILIRIKQVFDRGMMANKGFTKEEESIIFNYITDNADNLREVSLRVCEKIGKLYRSNSNWKDIARITCFN